MTSQGPLSPSGSRQTGSGDSWSNTGNVTASDNAYATRSDRNRSQILIGSGFGFSVPDGAVIDGLTAEVEISRSSSSGGSAIYASYLYDGTTNIAEVFYSSSDHPITTVDAYAILGGSSDDWGGVLTPAIINESLQFGIETNNQFSQTTSVDHIRVTVYYTEPNAAPTITVAPAVSYGSLTRLGPNNTPAVVSFTATDADGDALTYEIRTAASGGGTLVGSGMATSGVSKQHNIANGVPGLVNGNQTLYLRVFDGTAYSTDSSFTLLRDTGAPTVGTITHTPNPVVN